VTRDEAAAALRTYVSDCVDKQFAPDAVGVELKRREFKKSHLLRAVEFALNFYVEGRKTADDRKCAMRLEKATERYLRAVIRAEPFWSYIVFKAPEKSLGLEEPPVEYNGGKAWLPEHRDVVLHAELVRRAARATAEALKKDKKPPDLHRRALGSSFASIFYELGCQPTHSKQSTFEKPTGDFARFIRWAILASPHAENRRVVKQIEEAFASFVEDAAKHLPPHLAVGAKAEKKNSN
jgi:hypothetical protein